MAKFFRQVGQIFGFGSGEKPQSKAEHQMPLQTLSQIGGFTDLQKRITERSTGKGVGFKPESLKRETSALAAQRRAGLREKTLPLISQQASARGLGRSTIPISQGALASQAVERDVEQRLAERTIQSEQLAAQEQQNAFAQLESLIGKEAATVQTRRLFESGEFDRIQKAREARDAESKAGVERLINTAVGAASGFATGGPAGAVVGGAQGFSKPVGQFSADEVAGTDFGDVMSILAEINKAQVPISGRSRLSQLNTRGVL